MTKRTKAFPVCRTIIAAALVMTMVLIQLSCSAKESAKEIKLAPYDFSYQRYAQLLRENVKDGLVDYSAIKQNRGGLDSLVSALASADLTSATRDQRLAFYCNAYNIITIRSIVDAYPVGSIKDIDGVWDKKKWPVAGKELTLNEIENNILRSEFKEPRIHMAINCASIGCPQLLEMPYYPERLDTLLSYSAERFATSTDHNRVYSTKHVARLSSIFDWFGDDFIPQYYDSTKFKSLDKKKSAALNFVVSYFPPEAAKSIAQMDYEVEYMDYDWSLNDLSR